MSVARVIIRHLSFVGPQKSTASVFFGDGLNIVYGPSNTGKSSIVDALDFMLGREANKRPLKEIPEHEGYDQILLGLSIAENDFTLMRHINGGDYYCSSGLFSEKFDTKNAKILKANKPTSKLPSISDFLLEQVGLEEKRLKKNARNQTISLTLRNLLPLFLISETNIQKEGSPYIGDQYTVKTSDSSRLRLLLTGVDDSSLIAEETEKVVISRAARLEILQELIADQADHLDEINSTNFTEDELDEQLQKLETTLSRERESLNISQDNYSQARTNRNNARDAINAQNDRIVEINEMLERFSILDEQYESDLLRLEAIAEGGTLLSSIPSKSCPLCGATADNSSQPHKCEEDLEEILKAADSEANKIKRFRRELGSTVSQLHEESQLLKETLPSLLTLLENSQQELASLSPELENARNNYTTIVQTKSSVEKSLYILRYISELEEKVTRLEEEAPDVEKGGKPESLPTEALFRLSKILLSFLKKWQLGEAENVYFDNQTNDFVINGKHRSSNGKGHRALTHAGATLSLLKYALDRGRATFGTVILDSPLLAYEKPENADDDLTGTDVNKRFLNSIKDSISAQVIIFENKKSIPVEFEEGDQIIHFTKNEKVGRYGFFPISE